VTGLVYAQLFAGFIYLLGGGDLLVRGAVGLARRFRVPPVAVALSVVAFGTSLPELVVSVRASLTGHPNLILGNVVGSNIANVLLVGGAAAAVYPMAMSGRDVRTTGSIMVAVSLFFAALCVRGGIGRVEGLILLGVFVVTIASTARATIRAHQGEPESTPLDWVLGLPSQLPTIALFIVAGLVALPIGADFLVDAAVRIAERFGVSETVVGLSIVAIGTSLPEVTTSVLAAVKRRPGMAVGTIIGSNTFNLVAIMGITATISADPVPVSSRFLTLDLPVMLFTSALLGLFTWLDREVGRVAGLVLLTMYLLYLVALGVTV
jgi:cation:H+ antiporter